MRPSSVACAATASRARSSAASGSWASSDSANSWPAAQVRRLQVQQLPRKRNRAVEIASAVAGEHRRLQRQRSTGHRRQPALQHPVALCRRRRFQR
ncbi:hypothetical protein H1235_17160 [Pseudoxanthomonas sp. NC8]|nr:hypothetical protein H1235_17160 [Pseudoxanthomonas sp. NC8]